MRDFEREINLIFSAVPGILKTTSTTLLP